jgi:hypothetical protein
MHKTDSQQFFYGGCEFSKVIVFPFIENANDTACSVAAIKLNPVLKKRTAPAAIHNSRGLGAGFVVFE